MKAVLRKLFVRISKSNNDLNKRINEAKKSVKYNSYRDMIFIENYDEVIKILQYKHTLGMSLFIRDFIERKVPTEICVKYLLNPQY